MGINAGIHAYRFISPNKQSNDIEIPKVISKHLKQKTCQQPIQEYDNSKLRRV